MDLITNKELARDVAVLSLLVSTSFTGESQSQPVSIAKPPPEIIALMPSGQYIGQGQKDAKTFDVSLVIHESKPGGRFTGMVVVHQAAAPCAGEFPIAGEMKPDGLVHIESQDSGARGCELSFNLKLAGSELSGTLLGAEGTYQVKLKRQQ